MSADSRFLIHEIPKNETQIVDTLLGLVSSFMVAVVTDRALLVEWTDGWTTPLDERSTFRAEPPAATTSAGSSSSSSAWGTAQSATSSSSAVGSLAAPVSGFGGSQQLYDDDDDDGDDDDVFDDGAAHSGSAASGGAGSDTSGGGGGIDEVANVSATRRARRVSLADALEEPGLRWDLDELLVKYHRKQGTPVDSPVPVKVWDPGLAIEDVSCKDLKAVLGTANKFVKVKPGLSGQAYFMPLVMVNPHYSEVLEDAFQGGLSWAFSDMLNFLVRPVKEIQDSIHRFKVRYMDGNTVVGLEMAVMPGQGDWAGDGLMPPEQQNLFFSTASALVSSNKKKSGSGEAGSAGSSAGAGAAAAASAAASAGGGAAGAGSSPDEGGVTTDGGSVTTNDDRASKGVVFLLVTDNQAQIQARFHELEAADQVTGAGVVAILSSSGDGVPRVHLELQELWMLGFSDFAITTPGSRMGIVGTARTHKQPLVVVSENSVHASSAPYPCFAQFGAIQHTSCFVPSMLSKIPPDALVPC